MNTIAAVCRCFGEADTPEFIAYAKQMLKMPRHSLKSSSNMVSTSLQAELTTT